MHPFTFRAENNFLSAGYRVGTNPAALGDYEGELLLYLNMGIDGFFTDQPDLGVRAVSSLNVVPEPSTVVLVSAGGLGLLVVRRLRGRASRR